jgi:phosphate transport system substrate-binding protein
MKEYLKEFTSEKAWGAEGYLTEKGMIPMPDAERAEFSSNVKNMKTITK